MYTEYTKCSSCKLPILPFAGCDCTDVYSDSVDEEAVTCVDNNCGDSNRHFAHQAWEPGMHIAAKIITREEMLQCNNSAELCDLLFNKGFKKIP